MLHPTLERFFFTAAGDVNIRHVSYVGSTVFIVAATIFACCCWKNSSFRTFFVSKAAFIINWIYNLFTTETYRLQKLTRKLDKEIGKSWDELKRMEDVIAKKEELKRKLPAVSDKEGPSVPSAPQLSSDSSDRVTCDVHHEPTASHHASPPPSYAVHGKK